MSRLAPRCKLEGGDAGCKHRKARTSSWGLSKGREWVSGQSRFSGSDHLRYYNGNDTEDDNDNDNANQNDNDNEGGDTDARGGASTWDPIFEGP